MRAQIAGGCGLLLFVQADKADKLSLVIEQRLRRVEHQVSGDVESAFLVFDDSSVTEVAALWTREPPRLVVRKPEPDDLMQPRSVTAIVEAVIMAMTYCRGTDGAVLALQLKLSVGEDLWLYWRGGDFVDVARGERPELAEIVED